MNHNVIYMKRAELVSIYRDTQRLAGNSTSHSYKQSEKWNFREDLPPDEDLYDDAEKRSKPATVKVVNADTLTTAMLLKNSGLGLGLGHDPLVLNMASNTTPGGGVAHGAKAQEEVLFRCSNYDLCTNRKFYPLADDEFVITEDVSIIKDQDYNRLSEYVQFDFIAMAAPRKPSLVYNEDGDPDYMDQKDKELMHDKIDAIFRYAVYQNKGSLVLGALGCGAYGNPVKQVRDMFQQAINKYRYYFDNITFAVLAEGKNPNYDEFSKLH
jgi:uncharacterized protein (TIGR02452 family)